VLLCPEVTARQSYFTDARSARQLAGPAEVAAASAVRSAPFALISATTVSSDSRLSTGSGRAWT